MLFYGCNPSGAQDKQEWIVSSPGAIPSLVFLCMAYRTIILSGSDGHLLSGMWMGAVWQWLCRQSTVASTPSIRLAAIAKHREVMKNPELIRKLHGANMDIDLATPPGNIAWSQASCPWNDTDGVRDHRCAVKDTSICPFFCGIEYLDVVLCSYPNANPLKNTR